MAALLLITQLNVGASTRLMHVSGVDCKQQQETTANRHGLLLLLTLLQDVHHGVAFTA
jgi:hypothetical protein